MRGSKFEIENMNPAKKQSRNVKKVFKIGLISEIA